MPVQSEDHLLGKAGSEIRAKLRKQPKAMGLAHAFLKIALSALSCTLGFWILGLGPGHRVQLAIEDGSLPGLHTSDVKAGTHRLEYMNMLRMCMVRYIYIYT